MHRHDLDLISAYAAEDLADDSQARELVATCDVCRDEYRAQVAILSELAGLERPMMTDVEKSALHRDVWTELRRQAPSSESSPWSRTAWWYRWSAAAAGLFLVVGLLAVLSDRSGNDVFETIGNGLSTNESATDGGGRNSDDQGQAFGVDTTTASGEEQAPILPDDFSPGAAGEGSATYEAMIARVREAPPAPITSYSSAVAAEVAASCLEKAGVEDQTTVGDVDEDTPYLLVVPSGEPFDADSEITVVDSATCEVVHVDVPPE